MPQSTLAKSQPRKKRFAKRKNPAKTVKEWELQKVKKQLKRMIPKQEWKVKDATAAAAVVTTTATQVHLTNIVQGITENDRIGNRFRVRSWLLRLGIQPNVTAVQNFLRVILVKNDDGGSSVTMAELLEAATDYSSPLNDGFGQSFKVLFDKTYAVSTTGSGPQVDKIYRKLNIPVEWNADSAVTKNSLHLILLSDQATNGPTVKYYSRIRYTDA